MKKEKQVKVNSIASLTMF